MAVSGFVHQFCGSVATTFWSTSMPVVDSRATALRNQPAGWASFTTTVCGSGADSPLIITDGSFLASSCSSWAGAGGLDDRFENPAMAERLVEYGPWVAAARFQE